MLTEKLTTRVLWVAEAALLIGAVTASAWLSRSVEWQPLALLLLLLVLALVAIGILTGRRSFRAPTSSCTSERPRSRVPLTATMA